MTCFFFSTMAINLTDLLQPAEGSPHIPVVWALNFTHTNKETRCWTGEHASCIVFNETTEVCKKKKHLINFLESELPTKLQSHFHLTCSEFENFIGREKIMASIFKLDGNRVLFN